MDRIGDAIERMRRLREELVAGDTALLAVGDLSLLAASDEQLCEMTLEVESIGRLVDALRAACAGEIAERSSRGLGSEGLAFRLGHGKGVQLIAHLTRVSVAEAARRIRLGSATRTRTAFEGELLEPFYPEVAVALAAGEIGVESAARIVQCMDQARSTATDAEIAVAEAELVAAAATDTADDIALQARVWREFLDPDGAEPRDERLYRKRAFRLGRERDGLTPFSGELEPLGAALIKAAFDEAYRATKPRFVSDDESSDVDAELEAELETGAAKDDRTHDQRQYDIVTGLLTAGVRATGSEPGGMRSTAQVTAVITLDDLRDGKGVGWVEGVEEPVSAKTIQQLVCASGFATVVLGDDGEVLYLGKQKRLFSWQQIRAMLVRDGGCVWPGCVARAAECDAHHVKAWKAENGPTDIDNGALLCRFHHTMIHSSAYRMCMIRGRPHLLAPSWIDPEQRWIPLGKSRIARLNGLRKAG
jgi:hypothetical protein